MPSLRTVGSSLSIRFGGGWGGLFGVPFLAGGLWMAGQVVGAMRAGGGALTTLGGPMLALVALVFIGAGGTMMFGRRWVTIDRATRLVRKQWGWLWPMYTQRYGLEGLTVVTLGLERGDSDSPDRFPVALAGASGALLVLARPTGYAEARTCASSVAAHLGLPLEDRSTDHVTRLKASESDAPLSARSEAGQVATDLVDRPLDARSDVHFDGHVVAIHIPRPTRHPLVLLAQLIPLAMLVWLFAPLTELLRDFAPGSLPTLPLAWLLLSAFGSILLIIVVSLLVRPHVGQTIVTISPTQGIRVAERRLCRTHEIAWIAADAVLDVDFSTDESARALVMRTTEDELRRRKESATLPPASSATRRALEALSRFARGRGVIVKGRDGLTTFGHHLSDTEVRYLHSVVRRALLGRY